MLKKEKQTTKEPHPKTTKQKKAKKTQTKQKPATTPEKNSTTTKTCGGIFGHAHILPNISDLRCKW